MMFSLQELDIILDPQTQQAIARNIGRDPLSIALDKHIENASMVASQVKRLQRAQSKLPTFYACQAILPPLAYEQSSSEKCASRKRLEGETVLDLTCGLGIDTLALSRKFSKVVSIERDQVLCEVTRENLRRAGVDNVEVVNMGAEEFLKQCNTHFDWCFVDPDRRGAKGEKLYRLEDCSPNVLSLMDVIRSVADHVCIKCSPLFDVDEAQRLFPGSLVEVVSMGGECKEVNIYLHGTLGGRSSVSVELGEFMLAHSVDAEWSGPPQDIGQYKYCVIPDVSLSHARLVKEYFWGKADVWSDRGVALSREFIDRPLGREFEILSINIFDPKRLKAQLKGRRITIYNRNFPLGNAELCKRLGVKEGGREIWCFTQIASLMVALELNSKA